MGKPTAEETDVALAEAARLREHTDDELHLGKVLLNLHYRQQLLEHVYHAAAQFLHSGDGVREHSELLKAVEKYRDYERHPG